MKSSWILLENLNLIWYFNLHVALCYRILFMLHKKTQIDWTWVSQVYTSLHTLFLRPHLNYQTFQMRNSTEFQDFTCTIFLMIIFYFSFATEPPLTFHLTLFIKYIRKFPLYLNRHTTFTTLIPAGIIWLNHCLN